MDFERSRSCPTGDAGRLGASPRQDKTNKSIDIEDFNFDDFQFDSGDKTCLSANFSMYVAENDAKTVCSEPPKPYSVGTDSPRTQRTMTYKSSSSSPSRSPTSVHQFMNQISEDEEDNNSIASLHKEYEISKREKSDITEVISNAEKSVSVNSLTSTTPTRNPNLVVTGTPDRHQQQKLPPQKLPPKSRPMSTFRRLFACGAPEVVQDLKANVKQKGVATVEEVKGSFGDLGLTVKQVFSPVQNTKTGAGMVKKKVMTKVQKLRGEELEEEGEEVEYINDDFYTDEDECSDEGEEVEYDDFYTEGDEYSDDDESGSSCSCSLSGSVSEYSRDSDSDNASF